METHEKLYDILLSIKEDMGSLKSDTSGIKEHLKTLNGKVLSHESWISNAKGKVAVVASVVGGAMGLAVIWVKSQFD